MFCVFTREDYLIDVIEKMFSEVCSIEMFRKGPEHLLRLQLCCKLQEKLHRAIVLKSRETYFGYSVTLRFNLTT